MAEEDYDIDFYGDTTGDDHQDQQNQQNNGENHEGNGYDDDARKNGDHGDTHHDGDTNNHGDNDHGDSRDNGGAHEHDQEQQQEHGDSSHTHNRSMSGSQGRGPVDPNATTALMVSDLNWWITDDDIRGWLRYSEAEEGLKDITFSEHKVNGKSKGQVYIEFHTPQDATAAKHGIEEMPWDNARYGHKRTTTQYWNPSVNPFRTLPKDAPARGKDQGRSASSGAYNERGNFGGGAGFRGRGGYGGGRGNMGQNNYNRNFSGNMGYNPMGGGGFGGPNPQGNFAFSGRGHVLGGGMRGGGMRGRGGNMMGMNPMGGMNMGMPGNLGMGMMGPNAIPGFQGMPGNFGAPFGFGQNQGGGGGGDWGHNPHGAKRPRPE